MSISTHTDRVAVIKALAHPTRLHIAEHLSNGPDCVTGIQSIVGGDLSTVSKHLAVMRRAGWLTSDKVGLNMNYRLVCDCLDDFLRCVDSLSNSPSSCC